MMNSINLNSLPVPDAEAQNQSLRLTEQIIQDIQAKNGWIPFSHFMERALYTPGLGYYNSALRKIGAKLNDGSDFVTAPELSPIFAATLALPVQEALQFSQTKQILEFGAGTGKLAAGLLNALGEQIESYIIIDLSADLRAQQRETLERLAPEHVFRVQWLDKLPIAFDGVIVANEVLDAIPVQLFVSEGDNRWLERGVAINQAQQFCFIDCPVVQEEALALLEKIQAPAGYLTELHLLARAFIKTLMQLLGRGAVFLIDYGFSWHEYYHEQRSQGTLMCHYRHYAHSDPFFYPGLQDITAHAEFTGVYEEALKAGGQLLGYTSQANFLMNAGLLEQLSLYDPNDTAVFLPISQAATQLISDSGMGELFKVMALGKGIEMPLTAFSRADRSYTL